MCVRHKDAPDYPDTKEAHMRQLLQRECGESQLLPSLPALLAAHTLYPPDCRESLEANQAQTQQTQLRPVDGVATASMH